MSSDKSVTAHFVEGVAIPDAHLETVLREVLNKPTGNITCDELAGIEELDLMDLDIHDLTGLEHCTGLESLILRGNPFTGAAPLSSMALLGWLDVGECPNVADWEPISCLENVWCLQMDYDEIGSDHSHFALDFLLEMPNLELLYLPNNHITQFTSLLPWSHMLWLEVSDNDLPNLYNLPWMPYLVVLEASGNQIDTAWLVPDFPSGPSSREPCLPSTSADAGHGQHEALLVLSY